MIDLSALMSSLITQLRNDSIVSSETKIVSAYSLKKLPNPLLQTYVVLNIDEAQVEDTREFPQYDKVIHMTVSINIHRTETSNPVYLFRAFSNIVGSMETSNLFDMTDAQCKAVKRNADTNSILLPCKIKFDVYYHSERY